METKPDITQTVPFFMVSDMERSLQFYVDGLDFSMEHAWTPQGKIEWCALKKDAGALMLQQPRMPEHFPKEKPGAGVSICFICGDALAIYHAAAGKGMTVSEPFVGNNMWVVSFTDPDGYRLDFESATDVPEETKYEDWIKRNG